MSASSSSKQDFTDQSHRLKVLLLFGILSAGTAPFFVYAYWKWGSFGASRSVLAAVPFLLFTWVVWRVSRSVVFTGNWIIGVGYCVFLAVAYFTGGIRAPALIWSVAIPIVATVICGRKSGLAWLFLVLAKVSVFYWVEGAGYSPAPQVPDRGAGAAMLYVNMLAVIAFTFLLAAMSEYFKESYLHKLEEALDKIRTLKGLLPVCAWCRKIRNDKGYWEMLETYVSSHTDAEFSHGICPQCSAREHEELDKEIKKPQ